MAEISDDAEPEFGDAATSALPTDAEPDRRPPLNSEVRVGSHRLRMLGSTGNGLILIHADFPFGIYLVGGEGGPSLMTRIQWREFEERGEAEVLPASAAPIGQPNSSEKLRFVIDLLDAARVRNGVKAITIWLHAHWTPELRARWGEPDNAHTIRRWRSRKKTAPG